MFKKYNAYLAILPAALAIFFLMGFPLAYSIYLSFTNYSQAHYVDYSFIGLRNYIRIFTEVGSGLGSVFSWTAIYAFTVEVLSCFMGIVLAILLNDGQIKIRKIYRTMLILPWATPAFITLLVWKGLLNYNYGIVNMVLDKIGYRVEWLTDPFWARISVIVISVWYSFPFIMSVALGSLQAIPVTLYDACKIDGAGAIARFKAITYPFLIRSLAPIIFMGILLNFNNFGLYFITGGGPVSGSLNNPGATDLFITYIYKLAFASERYGFAAAYSILLFLMIALAVSAGMLITRKRKGGSHE